MRFGLSNMTRNEVTLTRSDGRGDYLLVFQSLPGFFASPMTQAQGDKVAIEIEQRLNAQIGETGFPRHEAFIRWREEIDDWDMTILFRKNSSINYVD